MLPENRTLSAECGYRVNLEAAAGEPSNQCNAR
jgi:hypothetical protein